MIESPPLEPPSPPLLHVELAHVCLVDGIWQDAPDHIAALDYSRLSLGAEEPDAPAGQARGNLYLLLDVSGEVEGRSEVERELVETLRREYSRRRGSVTFSLSESLRAANATLFEMNLQAPREARRLAGVSAVVLRGQDLYIAQAGPAVTYVEVNGHLYRYPTESDWFSEDQPLIAPQGNASAPLGIRREFACDLFHTSVAAGDVFVIATRGLTQLATTDELAQAFASRGSEDIANSLEDIANGADLSALIGELVDPRDLAQGGRQPTVEEAEASAAAQPAAPPVQLEHKPEVAVPAGPQTEPSAVEPPAPLAPAPTAQAAALESAAGGETPEERLARVREERSRRRREQLGAAWHVLGGLGALLLAIGAGAAGLIGRVFAVVDWKRLRAGTNRSLNTLFIATWNGLAMLVRLMLPGTPAKQSLIPRRVTKEPVWLRVTAFVLPVLFIAAAFGVYYNQTRGQEAKASALVVDAQKLLRSGQDKLDSDPAGAKQDLGLALEKIQAARKLGDSPQAEAVYDDIRDQINSTNGITLLKDIVVIARLDAAADLAQVMADENDIYFLDRRTQRIYHYRTNDAGTRGDPASGDGVMLQREARVDQVTVDQIRDITWTQGGTDAASGARGALVAVTGSALLQYDPTGGAWHAFPLADANQWGDIRAVASFSGNIYLLDASRNQIWKYLPAAKGYGPSAQPYLPANAPVALARAVDMAIDARIYVLTSDGAIVRLESGQRRPFDLTGLDVPFKNPTGIYTRPDNELSVIYIADAGNQRIVELDKTGHVTRQFKPAEREADAFANLKTVFFSPSKRKFYFISGSSVYMASIR